MTTLSHHKGEPFNLGRCCNIPEKICKIHTLSLHSRKPGDAYSLLQLQFYPERITSQREYPDWRLLFYPKFLFRSSRSLQFRQGNKIKVPFEIGPDVLYMHSEPEQSESILGIGKLIRESRRRSGMSQQELALVSGTSRTYISRIENNRSDIELDTLRKIIETGLGKKLEIRIK